MIYLVRHGIAVDDAASDDSRWLTEKGRKRFRRTAREFARRKERVDRIYTSPLVRAVQTAEILAEAIDAEEVRVLEPLRAELPAGAVLEAIKGAERVALVGHNPQMAELVAALAGEAAPFRKGSIVCVNEGRVLWRLDEK